MSAPTSIAAAACVLASAIVLHAIPAGAPLAYEPTDIPTEPTDIPTDNGSDPVAASIEDEDAEVELGSGWQSDGESSWPADEGHASAPVAVDAADGSGVAPAPWTNRATVTGYAPRCGDSGRGTRSGTPTRWGVVATDRSVIPEWSLIEIEGLDGTVFRAEDTGLIYGWHVDVWFPSCAQALQWGRQTRAVRVLRWGAQ